jgi:DNA-binding HxlR family transcriptional regulator
MTTGDDRTLQRLWDLKNLLSGSEWIPDIFVALYPGPLRRVELFEKIRSTRVYSGWTDSDTRNLQDRVMNDTLKRLKMAELVEHARDERAFPPRSLYRLTPAAYELFAALEPLVQWAEKHDEMIKRVQQRHRRGEED